MLYMCTYGNEYRSKSNNVRRRFVLHFKYVENKASSWIIKVIGSKSIRTSAPKSYTSFFTLTVFILLYPEFPTRQTTAELILGSQRSARAFDLCESNEHAIATCIVFIFRPMETIPGGSIQCCCHIKRKKNKSFKHEIM